MCRGIGLVKIAIVCAARAPAANLYAGGGEFRITVVDADTREPIACRMHLKNAKGVAQKAARMPFCEMGEIAHASEFSRMIPIPKFRSGPDETPKTPSASVMIRRS